MLILQKANRHFQACDDKSMQDHSRATVNKAEVPGEVSLALLGTGLEVPLSTYRLNTSSQRRFSLPLQLSTSSLSSDQTYPVAEYKPSSLC